MRSSVCVHICARMREAFVHEATIELDSDADQQAPGAAVTVGLCGHWEHQGACHWPHQTEP